jgi:hypothetical protein
LLITRPWDARNIIIILGIIDLFVTDRKIIQYSYFRTELFVENVPSAHTVKLYLLAFFLLSSDRSI